MNPEHIELYQKLSQTRIYKERFSEWERGDNYLNLDEEPPHILHFSDLCEGCEYEANACNSIHIPPVFDPERPERCLWGMVDWSKCIATVTEPFGKKPGHITIMTQVGRTISEEDRLDIALIKAILRQEGGEE